MSDPDDATGVRAKMGRLLAWLLLENPVKSVFAATIQEARTARAIHLRKAKRVLGGVVAIATVIAAKVMFSGRVRAPHGKIAQSWAWLASNKDAVGAFAAAFGIWFTLWSIWRNYRQRLVEHAWKRAQMGKELVDELLADPDAVQALEFVQQNGIEDDQVYEEMMVFMTRCLVPYRGGLVRINQNRDHKKVQGYFDALFFRLSRIEQAIRVGLVGFEDIRVPLEYYVWLLAGCSPTVERYLRTTSQWSVVVFFHRFPIWRSRRMPAGPHAISDVDVDRVDARLQEKAHREMARLGRYGKSPLEEPAIEPEAAAPRTSSGPS